MPKITAIKDKINQLGPGEFQNFCDALLAKMNQFGLINSLGMKAGTGKTTQGSPDTFFRRKDGKYVLVEYTTQKEGIYKKIQEDLEKCFDPTMTGISVDDIGEIIYCHTSSNLHAGEDKELHQKCEKFGIALTVFGIDEIANQVSTRFPTIAKDFLEINIDTNQILDIDDFIRQYDSRETAAPLDTVFQFRTTELTELKASIWKNKVVILHGHAGVGKTRLALQAVREVAKEGQYQLFCVRSNSQDLFEDFAARTEKPGRYIFFVDDANELIGLNYILGCANREEAGYNLKILLTVRDYVKEKVIRDTYQFTNPELFEVLPFKDDEIKEFLDVNLGIKNDQYIDQIIRIAEGNPRIAYMAGRLALDSNTLKAIHDVTDVYEHYYASVIENNLRSNPKLCVSAGILSLVHAVVLDRLDNLSETLKLAKLSEDAFEENIRELSRMEVVEIQKERIAVISDQCLANYMLYYVFFAQRMIPFSDILYVGFKYFKDGIIRSMNTLLNLFAKETLQNYMTSEVSNVWDKLENEKDPSFEEYARVFHVFKPLDAFIIANNKIKKIEVQPLQNEFIDFERNSFKDADQYLGFLTEYRYSEDLKTAIDILLSFAEKSEECAIIGYHWLKNHYGVNQDTLRYGYSDVKIILDRISNAAQRSEILSHFALAYARYVLSFEFDSTEMGRGNTFKMYRFQIKNSAAVKMYRKKAWDIVETLAKETDLTAVVQILLKKYASSIRTAEDHSIVLDDQPSVEAILSDLDVSELEKALLLRNLQYGWTTCGVNYSDSKEIFNSPDWKIYALLENGYAYSRLEYEEYEKTRNDNLKKYAEQLKASDIPTFITAANRVIALTDDSNKYAVNEGVGQVLDNLSANRETYLAVLDCLQDEACRLEPNIYHILKESFKLFETQELWKLLDGKDYQQKNLWEYLFFVLIPAQDVDEKIYALLFDYLKSDSDRAINQSALRRLDFLDKFLTVDAACYTSAARIILKKKEYNRFIAQMYLSTLFLEQLYTPEKLLNLFASDIDLLKTIYIFALGSNSIEDYNGCFLKAFLESGYGWDECYTSYLADQIENDLYDKDYHRVNILWKLDRYMECFDMLFDKLSKKDAILLSWKLGTAFAKIFSEPKDEDIDSRQQNWVIHFIDQNAQDNKVFLLFDALVDVRETIRKTAIERFLLLNSDYSMFEKIPLDPSHWGGSEEEIIPDLHRRIKFLKSLLPMVKEVKYLRHAKRIQDRIDFWKSQIGEEEIQQIVRRVY